MQGKRIRVESSRPRIEFSHQTKTVFVGGLEVYLYFTSLLLMIIVDKSVVFHVVKLGYNDDGHNKLTVITNVINFGPKGSLYYMFTVLPNSLMVL